MAAIIYEHSVDFDPTTMAQPSVTCYWTETYNSMTGMRAIKNRQVGTYVLEFDISDLPDWARVTDVQFDHRESYSYGSGSYKSTYIEYLTSLGSFTGPKAAQIMNEMISFGKFTIQAKITPPVSPVVAASYPEMEYWIMCKILKAALVISYDGISEGTVSVNPIPFGETNTLNVQVNPKASATHVITHDVEWYMEDDPAYSESYHLDEGVIVNSNLIPMNWLNVIPSLTEGNAICSLRTYIDGMDMGTFDIPFVCYTTEDNVGPEADPILEVVNEGLIGCPDLYRYYSKSKVIVNADLKYGATIVSSTITGEGYTQIDGDLLTDIYQTTGEKTYVLTITDSRGFSSTKSIKCNVLPASKPVINSFSIERTEDDATKVYFSIDCEIDSCGGYNYFDTINSIVTYKQSGGTSIIGSDPINPSGTHYVITLDPDTVTGTFSSASGYSFDAIIKDACNEAVSSANIIAAHVNLYLSSSNYGVGVGCVSTATTLNHKLEVNYPADFEGNFSVENNMNCGDMIGESDGITELIAKYINISGTNYELRSVPYGGSGTVGFITFEKA